MKPPAELLAAFRAAEQPKDLAVILVDEGPDRQRSGFDAITMRVLASWQHTEHRWVKPKAPMPDGGEPTTKAWNWMWSGYRADLESISVGAGVSVALAAERFAILRHNRLVYPDGTLAKWLLAALTAHVAKRLSPKDKRKADAGGDAN